MMQPDTKTGPKRLVTTTLVCALVCALAAAVAMPTAAFAQPTKRDPDAKRPGEADDQASYRFNEEGKKLVRLRKYEEALIKFRVALKYFPLSNAIFNVGSMLYTLKNYEDSFAYLEQTLKAPLNPQQRQIVLSYRANVLKMLRHSHKDILVRTNPPGAKLKLNGKLLPFAAPTRVLVKIGTADISILYPGFKEKHIVVNSTQQSPPKDVSVRLLREEPYSKCSVRCPPGSDIFIDGQMRGFELVRLKMLVGPHTIRCGKTSANTAFERRVTVRKGIANPYDFSQHKK